MWRNQWPGPIPPNLVPPTPDETDDSLTGYIRRGARAGMAAAVGMELVFVVFLVILRGGLILLGSEESDGILDCLAILFAGLFIGIGYGVGAVCGAIAFSMQQRK